MSRICPNCNYMRKVSDNVPEWQCPSCEIAYNKGAGAAGSEYYGQISVPAATGNRQGQGLLKKLLVLLAIVCAVWISRPVWQVRTQEPVVKAGTAQPEVILFATSWCGYCAATRSFFRANGIQFTELDIEKSTVAQEGYQKLGGRGVPLVIIGDSVIHGYNEREMQSTLRPWLKAS